MTDHRPTHHPTHRPAHRPTVSRAARGLAFAVLLAAPLSLAVPAAAHPFGPPLQLELEGVAHNVNVRWTAADDDWLALARHVGAFDEVPEDDGRTQLSGAERIARSGGVADYVLEHVGVTQHDQPCVGEIVHLADDLVSEGVIVQFTCEEQVYEVDVTVGLLTDVHPAYRTVATSLSGGVPGDALYTATDTQHRWDFGAEAVPTSRTPGGAVVGVAALLVAAGALLWLGLRTPPHGDHVGRAEPAPDRTAPREGDRGAAERTAVGSRSAT